MASYSPDATQIINANASALNRIGDLLEKLDNKDDSVIGSPELVKYLESIRDTFDELTNDLNKISKSFKDIAKTNGISEKELKKLIDAFREKKKLEERRSNTTNLNEIQQIDAAIKKRADLIDKIKTAYAFDDRSKEFQDLLQYIEQAEGHYETIDEAVENIAQNQRKINKELDKHAKSVAIITEGYNKILGGLKSVWEKWKEVDHETMTYGRELGLTKDTVDEFRKSVLESYRHLSARYGVATKEIAEFQKSLTEGTKRAMMLSSEQTEYMLAVSKFTGRENINQMVNGMDDFGASVDTATDYIALAFVKAEKAGLNAKSLTSTVAKNIKMSSQFTFKNGIDGLTKMAIQSQQLKFNFESIGKSIEQFDNIQGAIETSAQLQMLGGNFAAAFSNPLEMMSAAQTDAELFQEKLLSGFKNLAYFDAEKGMMDMSAIDKRRLREAAKYANLNYEDAFNMATQQSKVEEIKKNPSAKLSDEDWSMLASKASFDKTKGQWTVNYLNKEGEQSVTIDKINSRILSEIRDDASDSSDDMLKHVNGIHSLLVERFKGKAHDMESYNEYKTGFIEGAKTNIASLINGVPSFFKDKVMNPLTNNAYLATTGVIGAGALGLGGKFLWNGLRNKAIGKIAGKTFDKVPNLSTSKLGKGAASVFKAMSKHKGKIGLTALAIGTALALMSAQDSSEALNDPNAIRRDFNSNPQQPNNSNQANNYQNTNSQSANPQYNNQDNYNIENQPYIANEEPKRTRFSKAADATLNTAYVGYMAGSTKYGQKIGSKVLGRAMPNFGKFAKGANVGLAIDLLNAGAKGINLYEEGSNIDKIANVLSSTASYAALGNMLFPGLGAAIGGAFGAIKGITEQYRDEISEKLYGDENKQAKQDLNAELTKIRVDEKDDEANLRVKSYIATIGMHDLMITEHNLSRGLRADGTERGFFEDENGNFSLLGFATGGVVPGDQSKRDGVIVRVTPGERILTKAEQDEAKKRKMQRSKENDNNGYGKVDLNISGTLKLDMGGSIGTIEASRLMNNQNFRNQLVNIIQNSMNQRMNQGIGVNKNAVGSISNANNIRSLN